MTGWDVLDSIIKAFPPFAATILLVAAAIIFLVGFSKHGANFLKYGFGQQEVSDLSKKIDDLIAEVNTKIDSLRTEFNAKFDKLEARIEAIETRMGLIETRMGVMEERIEIMETNHFGHLKNFLTELTSILLDKGIINNGEKTRLDNQLSGM